MAALCDHLGTADANAIPYHHHIAERPKKAQTPQLHDARWEYPSTMVILSLPKDPVSRPYIYLLSFPRASTHQLVLKRSKCQASIAVEVYCLGSN